MLLIEDNNKDLLLFEHFVKEKRLPYDFVVARSVREAIQKIKTNDYFDFLVCKYELSDGTALNIIDYIKNKNYNIIIIGYGNEKVPVEKIERASAEFIVKDKKNKYLESLTFHIENSIRKKNEKKTFNNHRSEDKELEYIHNRQNYDEKYRLMIESNKDFIFLCSSDFRIRFMNSALIKKIGYYPIGEKCEIALSSLDEKCPLCCRENGSCEEPFEKEIKHPVGNSLFIVSGTHITQSDGSILKMVIYKDITNIKFLQNMTVRSEKLAATKKLAVSIAHEINSPLQAATIMIDSLKKKYFYDNALLNNINLLKNSFYSIRDTVKNLLDLNPYATDQKDMFDLNKIIEKTIELNLDLLNENNIKCIFEPSKNPLNILASSQQFQQVVMNLLKNSIESMENKNKKILSVKTNYEDDNIVLVVSDTGSGISEEDLESIFDPFYTQKKKMGLGVGLSVCHDIIENYKGSITAKNLPEGGAAFTINLPNKEDSKNEKKD